MYAGNTEIQRGVVREYGTMRKGGVHGSSKIPRGGSVLSAAQYSVNTGCVSTVFDKTGIKRSHHEIHK